METTFVIIDPQTSKIVAFGNNWFEALRESDAKTKETKRQHIIRDYRMKWESAA